MTRQANPETRSQWRERLRRFTRSKLSVADFCRGEQVSAASFYQWRRKLAESSAKGACPPTPSRAAFVPVQVATSAANLQVTFPNGAQLEIAVSDREQFRMVIGAIAHAQPRRGDA